MSKLFSLLGCSALVALSLAATTPSARAASAKVEDVDVEHFTIASVLFDRLTGYYEAFWETQGLKGKFVLDKYAPSGSSTNIETAIFSVPKFEDMIKTYFHNGPGLYRVTVSVYNPANNQVFVTKSGEKQCPDGTGTGSGSGPN